MAIPILKKCHQCRHMLPHEAFWKRAASKDGLQHICKSCMKYAADRRIAQRLDTNEAVIGQKTCQNCGHMLPLDAFAIRRASPNGRQYVCKECMATDRSPDSHMTPEQKNEAQTLLDISVDCGWEPGYNTMSWSEIFERFPACTACGTRYHIHEYLIIDGIRSILCRMCDSTHDMDPARITYDPVPDFRNNGSQD